MNSLWFLGCTAISLLRRLTIYAFLSHSHRKANPFNVIQKDPPMIGALVPIHDIQILAVLVSMHEEEPFHASKDGGKTVDTRIPESTPITLYFCGPSSHSEFRTFTIKLPPIRHQLIPPDSKIGLEFLWWNSC
jgi:hypothetical protein